jgi:hypothetical protein
LVAGAIAVKCKNYGIGRYLIRSSEGYYLCTLEKAKYYTVYVWVKVFFGIGFWRKISAEEKPENFYTTIFPYFKNKILEYETYDWFLI